MNSKVAVYTSNHCPVCTMVRNFLSDMNIEFEEVSIDLQPMKMMKLIRQTKRLSVPQTNIGGEWVFGFDPVRMLELLNKQEK